MNEMTGELLDALFPPPSPPPSPLSPQRLPGATHESTLALLKSLKKNHTTWHTFVNDREFHNHVGHRALALYALGASAPVIEAAYEVDASQQRALGETRESITSENFKDHLGDETFYKAYLDFFTDILSKEDAVATIEKYIFSDEYNYGAKDGKQVKMLDRSYDALYHTIIQISTGLDFGMIGLIVEGLAQGAVRTGNPKNPMIERALKNLSSNATFEVAAATNKLASLTLGHVTPSNGHSTGTHAFTILQRILDDEHFDNLKVPEVYRNTYRLIYKEPMSKYGELVSEYAEQWIVDLSQPGELERKIEELSWLNTIFYVLEGYKEGGDFQADFVFMHLVTSAFFLPTLVVHLSPRNQVLLLRTYFAMSLLWWIARGRPSLDIPAFFSASIPTPPGGPTHIHAETLPSPSSPYAVTPNAWFPILQSAIVHSDDHVCKIQRAFMHYDRLYGTRAPGCFKETGLKGAEVLDGTIFVRAASFTADAMGWIREGQEKGVWSVEGWHPN